jgi:hypothetical protein
VIAALLTPKHRASFAADPAMAMPSFFFIVSMSLSLAGFTRQRQLLSNFGGIVFFLEMLR